MIARVNVFGTGALGMLFGGRLARSGVEVTLVGTWSACLAALSSRGVLVEEDGDVWAAPVLAARPGDAVTPTRLTMVLVKSYQTPDVSSSVARATAADGLVLTLQNGLGSAELLATAGCPVAIGVTSQGAEVVAPGTVRSAGDGPTVIGSTDPGARLAEVVELLRDAGFDARAADDVDRHRWRKLAVNCAINPLTAVLRCPNGHLLGIPEARETMMAAAREVATVAAARGVELADPVPTVLEVARRTAGNRSSMLQDVERGTRTEIDAICGAVVEAGRRAGISTPVNERLWTRVSALTGGGRNQYFDIAPAPLGEPPAAPRGVT